MLLPTEVLEKIHSLWRIRIRYTSVGIFEEPKHMSQLFHSTSNSTARLIGSELIFFDETAGHASQGLFPKTILSTIEN